MAKKIETIDEFREYVDGVIYRATHHAGEVTASVLTLVGAGIWAKDPGPILVRTYRESMANMAWVKIGGRPYALAYDHATRRIVLRDRGQSGKIIAKFSDATNPERIWRIFRSLRSQGRRPA